MLTVWPHFSAKPTSVSSRNDSKSPLINVLTRGCEIPSSTILALRNVLHDTGFFDLTLPHTDDFVVHMTLTEGRSGNEVDQTLLDRLKLEVNAESFACHKIAYVQPNDAFQFSVQRVIPLGAI